jgi:hypothetical protein
MGDNKPEEETIGATSIDEYEDRFNEIDSALDAIRSSIKGDDNDIAQSLDDASSFSSLNASLLKDALAEESAGEMGSETVPASSSTHIDPIPEQGGATKKADSQKSPLILLAVLIPVILAFVVGQKLSPAVDSYTTSTVIPQTLNNDQTVNYQGKRKIERCRYINGEKHCESDEQSVSSSSPGGTGEQRVFHQATFQKCRYINGQSHCESFQQQLSSSDPENPFTQKQLLAEFHAADVNQDDQVSRPEFERYKTLYLQEYPDIESTFAKFEDFDSDTNGFISVNEHEGYYKALGLL